MLAGMFVYGGLDSLRNPDPKVKVAEPVVAPVTDASGGRLQTHHLIQINGAVQVVAGVALATGVLARPAGVLLAASLVPTTLAGHPFWQEEDPNARRQQTIHFLKNLAMAGGLLVAAAGTGRSTRAGCDRRSP